jgi:hypothetical protein
MLCTHQQIRRQVVIRLPNAIANANADSDQSTLAELLNAVGLIATVSVDSPFTSLSGRYLEQLYEVYVTLCLTLSTCHKSARASSVPSQSTSADRSNSQFHPPNSLWARRHARFNLLPNVGTLDCLVTWHELVSQVLDQVRKGFELFVVRYASNQYGELFTDISELLRRGCLSNLSRSPHDGWFEMLRERIWTSGEARWCKC